MNLIKLLISCGIFLGLLACQENKKEEVIHLVKEWQGKEIVFPDDIVFTMYGKDTVDYKIPSVKHKIVMYVDSMGCTSCKLQLAQWKKFIYTLDSLYGQSVPVLLFFYPKDKKEIQYLLKRDRFKYPVCVDEKDVFNRKNHFPSDLKFQTFLVDENNKVVVIGNPIHNMQIKELYLKELTGKTSDKNEKKTTYHVKTTHIDMGSFPKDEQRIAKFFIKNTGSSPLVILDSSTTCGCAVTQYDPRPAAPGDSLMITVTYTPKDTGLFEEWITVKCNTVPQNVKLSVKGIVM